VRKLQEPFLDQVIKRVGESVDTRRAEWVFRAKRVAAIQRALPALLTAEVHKRVTKRCDQYGNVVDYKVERDNATPMFFKSAEAASRAALSGLSDQIRKAVDEERKRMRSLVVDEEVDDEMVREAQEPDERMDREVAAQASEPPMGASLAGAPARVDDDDPAMRRPASDPGFASMDAERARERREHARKNSRIRLF
jgi:hypothetical protein